VDTTFSKGFCGDITSLLFPPPRGGIMRRIARLVLLVAVAASLLAATPTAAAPRDRAFTADPGSLVLRLVDWLLGPVSGFSQAPEAPQPIADDGTAESEQDAGPSGDPNG
jgi:hypothetical protein